MMIGHVTLSKTTRSAATARIKAIAIDDLIRVLTEPVVKPHTAVPERLQRHSPRSSCTQN
jgi:hypothetical protein